MKALESFSNAFPIPVFHKSLLEWRSMPFVLIGFIFLYVAVVSVYRLTFHPLAKYPGPLLSKLSDWSIVIQAASGNRHLDSWREHEKYGPIVRIAPNTLSINTILALKETYGSRKANVQKADWYRTIDAPSGAFSTHSEIDREKHAFRRRVLDHAFSESALRSAEPFVVDNVRLWCKHLGEGASRSGGWTPAKKMSDWSTYLGFDIMGDLTFGKRFNCMESDEHRYIPDLMMRATKFIYVFGFLPFVKIVRPLLGTPILDLFAGQLARDSSTYIKYANAQMANRIAAEEDSTTPKRKDFMHYLLHAKDPKTGKGFTTTELNSDSSLLISAGSDTTSITLSATIFYLLHYPLALEKVTKEVRGAFGSVDEIRGGGTLNGLAYLRTCIDESLRLSPPVASHLPREVLAGGLTIDGHYIPKGTVVGTGPYAMHHKKEYYPEPFVFRPERWIVNEDGKTGFSAESVATANAAFCPFSIGPRGCIGKNVAYLEVMLALATLLYQYDMQLPEGEEDMRPTGEGRPDDKHWGRRRKDEYQMVEHFLPEREGPMVEFKARQK